MRKFIDRKQKGFRPNHKEVEKALNEYLAEGGTITQLEPEPEHEYIGWIIEKSAINQTVTRNLRPI